jgi:transposase
MHCNCRTESGYATNCGLVPDRDLNAAINLTKLSVASSSET